MRSLIIAFQGLRGAPVRSLLVILALTLGMLGFVAVLSADQVMRETVTQRALLAGGREPTFEASVRGVPTTDEVDLILRQLERSTGATAAAVKIDDADVGVWVDGVRLDTLKTLFVTPSLTDVQPFPVVDGDWLMRSDTVAPRVVINEAAAVAFPAVGTARLGTADVTQQLVVVGVMRDGDDDPQVYAHTEDYATFASAAVTMAVSLHGGFLSESSVSASARRLAALGSPIEFVGIQRTDRVTALAAEVESTSRVLFVLGSLSLLSTIVGIMNVGLATARARAKEFALRRTMGASRGHIAFVVMLESQLLAVSAAFIAVGGSYLLFPVVIGAFNPQLGVGDPAYNPLYGIVCLVVASVTAMLSSLVPALLSYRRDLSAVMRE